MTASDASAPARTSSARRAFSPDERERERLVEKASAIHRNVDQGEHRVEPEEREAFAVETTIGPSSAPHVSPRRPLMGLGADESSTQERSIPP
jgi:hypothetical protein